ncbi:isocitrate lyase/phosphoenolpyruvate mutase family protein [Stappia sp.]|uniref:isocitrate lyase/PEP mutase family protein n=1 Tax=Stappia sp. TaxID=1870903 RepID=UPI0032D98E5C
MTEIDSRRARFRALHNLHDCFILPNAHDIGTARILEGLGFSAIATTSAGFAFTQGVRDGEGRIGRDSALAHAAEIVRATDLPVNADLENGYGHDPEDVAETVRAALDCGLAGCSIEDASGDPSAPYYALDHAVARIEAAVAAKRAAPDFVLTARAEAPIRSRRDLDATIRRLAAYRDAGADVVYALHLRDRAHIARVVAEVGRPVNVVTGAGEFPLTRADLAALGVRRMSVGSGLARAAFGTFHDVAHRLKRTGRFSTGGRIERLTAFDDLLAPPRQPGS